MRIEAAYKLVLKAVTLSNLAFCLFRFWKIRNYKIASGDAYHEQMKKVIERLHKDFENRFLENQETLMHNRHEIFQEPVAHPPKSQLLNDFAQLCKGKLEINGTRRELEGFQPVCWIIALGKDQLTEQAMGCFEKDGELKERKACQVLRAHYKLIHDAYMERLKADNQGKK